MRYWIVGFALAVLSPGPWAFAADSCDFYKRHVPFLYKMLCKYQRTAKTAGGNSTFANGFNITPGALPTEPTSYGLETIASSLRVSPRTISPDFALIKGYHKVGTGISTASANTFFSNDLLERAKAGPLLTTFDPIEQPTGHVTNLNIGLAIAIPPRTKTFETNLGLSLRYNKTTNTLGGGPGLLMSKGPLTWGVGVTSEQVSKDWPSIIFMNAMLSARVSFFEFEYDFLKNAGGIPLEPVNIWMVTSYIGRLNLSVALRHLNYIHGGEVFQEFASIQMLFSRHLSLGFLYNYIPGADSLALQLYL